MSAPRYILGSKYKGLTGTSRGATTPRGSGGKTGGDVIRSGAGYRTSTPIPTQPALEEDRRIGEFSSAEDVCPVCKSDRYLQPKLRLMISWCYHKMCESCMDRIFSLGPAPCPICGVTIRKNQFRPQIFENLGVQKEVAIRKRTAKIFNKREEDFNDLQSYNDYLEEFEDITFNLINNKDLDATEARIKMFESQNRALIESNLSREEQDAELLKLREEAERRAKEEAKMEYERLDEEDRLAKEAERKSVLEKLESSDAPARSIVVAAKKSALKRSTARTTSEATSSLLDPNRFSSLKFFAGLKAPVVPVAEEPGDLLAELGWYDSYESLYSVRSRQEGYASAEQKAAAHREDQAGWVVEEVWEKAIRSAVAELFLKPVEHVFEDAEENMMEVS